jgi:hypothetical protein
MHHDFIKNYMSNENRCHDEDTFMKMMMIMERMMIMIGTIIMSNEGHKKQLEATINYNEEKIAVDNSYCLLSGHQQKHGKPCLIRLDPEESGSCCKSNGREFQGGGFIQSH